MLTSLVTQTIGIENMQVLFIDDRSTDNSLDIIKPYLEKFPNIELYHLDKNTVHMGQEMLGYYTLKLST